MNSDQNDAQPLPDGWILCTSKSNPGRKYYFNKKTGTSSWTQPTADEDEKSNKRDGKQKIKREKMRAEKKKEDSQKNLKRKSGGGEISPVKKKQKVPETPEKRKTITPKKIVTVQQIIESPRKRTVEAKKETPPKPLVKNSASARLSLLQDQLNSEVQAQKQTEKESPQSKKLKISPKTTETSAKIAKLDKSPNQNEAKPSGQSPSNDSVQSFPSPSQFFAANKIISSMKAQLPEEFNEKAKPKNSFADIEEGICNQTTEYPYMKHPGTPPQFSEASKLVSAIKSKLSYKAPSSKDFHLKTFSSAKDRMESLRNRLSNEPLNEITDQDYLSKIELPVEKMEVEESKETKENLPTGQSTKEVLNNVNIKDDVVLVADTNIFIYELDVIKNVLNSRVRGYTEQPTLLVPWRVINELDRLKDNNNGNGAICKPARSAMDYLYKSLPENDRIKGQSLRDANSHIYPCESPDDEILNCCLQQAERGKSVILLSNDKNLCNKATINGVKCIALDELKPLLENNTEPTADPDLYASVKHFEDNTYRLLSNILENEMRAKYNNLWQHIIFKPPPWTFADVVSCLLKHWIAVFNEVFPRIEHLFTDLKNTYTSIQRKGPDSLAQSEVSTFKELCLEIAKKCQIIPEYMELAKSTVERLQRRNEDSGSSNTNSSTKSSGEIMVINAFEGLWTVFSSYCSKLSSALNIPHNLEDKLPGSDTLDVLTSKWPEFSGQLRELTFAIKNSISIETTDPQSPHLNYFEMVFRKSLALLSLDDTGITKDSMRIFCYNCKNMLQEAYTKFTDLVELLDVCRNNISNSNNNM